MAAMNGSEVLYRAVFPDEVHLASSRYTDGAFRRAILDNVTNVLRGQAEFVKIDGGDDTAPDGGPSALLAAALGVAAGVLVTVVMVKASPRGQALVARGRSADGDGDQGQAHQVDG